MVSTATIKFGIDRYAAVRNNIRSGANNVGRGALPMASGRSKNQDVNAHGRPPLVNDILRVHDITNRVGSKRFSHFAMTLKGQGKRYDAIAGPDAAALSVGDIVRLQGCFLNRGGKLVLVICSLKPSSQLEQDESEGSGWKPERRY
jgi:hypothetical protein